MLTCTRTSTAIPFRSRRAAPPSRTRRTDCAMVRPLDRLAPRLAIALLAVIVAPWATTHASAPAATAPPAATSTPDAVRALDGRWIYVEDRTPGRTDSTQGPPMSPGLTVRVEEGAVVLVRRDHEVRLALDGTPVDVDRGGGRVVRHIGTWKDGTLTCASTPVDPSGGAVTVVVELRPTDEGLLVRVPMGPDERLALYRHPEDIPLPDAAPASIGDLSWLAGAWIGTRGRSSVDERWSPPLGGAMLGTSRLVNSRGEMLGFEFLRIVERDGSLVYVAQPGGGEPTEFVLTEIGPSRAVFANPRHDHPQCITYELSPEGELTASIGFRHGGMSQRFEFKREGA